MTTANGVLEVLRGYLGVAENPPHSNRTIIGQKFSQLPGADAGNGVPWCAETVSVAQHEAGNTDFQVSASCLRLVGWYRDGTNGTWLGNPGVAGLEPGDEGFLGRAGGDHTFTVEHLDGNNVISLEGNWGDKVARVSRPVQNIYGFGRPNYAGHDESKPPPQVSTMEDDVRYLVQAPDFHNNAVYVHNDINRRWVQSPTELAGIQARFKQNGWRDDVRTAKKEEIQALVLVGPEAP